METTTSRPRRGQTLFNAGQFRRKMLEAGVTQTELAEVSGLTQPAISAVLNQRAYAGWSRVSRMQDALHQLALQAEAQRAQAATETERESVEAQTTETKPEEKGAPKSEPRIRRL